MTDFRDTLIEKLATARRSNGWHVLLASSMQEQRNEQARTAVDTLLTTLAEAEPDEAMLCDALDTGAVVMVVVGEGELMVANLGKTFANVIKVWKAMTAAMVTPEIGG